MSDVFLSVLLRQRRRAWTGYGLRANWARRPSRV